MRRATISLTRIAGILTGWLFSAAAMAQCAPQASSQASSSAPAPCTVPEPSSLPLVALGLVGAAAVAVYLRRKK
jgi:hypothetical protein